jgi:hypothetical protein
MSLGRERADVQLLRDLLVGEAGGDSDDDLSLAIGEHLGLVGRDGRIWQSGKLGDQPFRDSGCEQRLAFSNDPNGMEQLRRIGVLEKESAGPWLQA